MQVRFVQADVSRLTAARFSNLNQHSLTLKGLIDCRCHRHAWIVGFCCDVHIFTFSFVVTTNIILDLRPPNRVYISKDSLLTAQLPPRKSAINHLPGLLLT